MGMLGEISCLVSMSNAIDELQAFTHLTGTVEYDVDEWYIVLKAGEVWIDRVYIT